MPSPAGDSHSARPCALWGGSRWASEPIGTYRDVLTIPVTPYVQPRRA